MVDGMKWNPGTWSNEFWQELESETPRKFPYNAEAYADSLGVNWGAIQGDRYALPMAYRTKYGLGTAYQPFGVQQWGPVGAHADDAASLRDAVRAIPGRFKKVNIAMSRPDHWHHSEGWQRHGLRWERWTECPNYELDLTQSVEQLHQGFSSQCQRNVKKSSQFKHEMFEHDAPEVLLRQFELNQGKRYQLDPGFLPGMRSAMHHLMHIGRGAVWTLYSEGNQFLAGALFAFSGNRAVLLFSAISEHGRSQQSMTYLINEAITYMQGRWEILDFEGSAEPGLARFYQGFGAELRPYLRYERYAIL